MRIADVGEFPLIARLARIVASAQADVVVGIGDDAAALDLGGDRLVLFTVDSQVEGSHFVFDRIPPHLLGRRLLAVNASDIAAMGGRPTHALVSLVLPPDLALAWVEELYAGLEEEAERFGVAVVGGNVARSPGGIVLDLALVGGVPRAHLLTRAGARPGDLVLVTGALGEAAAGLIVSGRADLPVPAAEGEALVARHLVPTPRVREGRLIAASGLATAMTDLSDGLGSDVGHLCDRSRVGVRIHAEKLPVPPAVARVAELAGEPPWDLALFHGEDFELVFTCPPDAVRVLSERVSVETGTPVSVVGEVLPAPAGRWLVLPTGEEIPLAPRGFRHFSGPAP
ncbi:MAG TPA: thiamine-phosphate kinase [Candidatus Bipolaricaulis anaerobius]|nr:thiamine-phosphate kinase [Candidatus Bipolaricaulis anaerobius]HNS23691.1 thiamine-phosphate kinase [Candidatus Bipolaricaulis anaerobius]